MKNERKHLSEEGVTCHKNVRVKSSTIYTKFHKSCNKASMLETSNEDYEEKVIKEKNIILSKNSTDSFP